MGPRVHRFFTTSIVLVIALVMISVSITRAQTMFMSYTTGSQVFNVSSSSVAVTLKLYDPNGTEVATLSDTINGTQAKTYFPILGQNNFVGSLVVSSQNGNIVSMANLIAGNIAAGSYNGQNTGSNIVRLPLLMQNNGGYFSWFGVQNVGSTPASITINYSDGASAVNATIPANSTSTFFQTMETHSQSVFAAKITSNVPIIAAAFQENLRILFAYSGFTDAGNAYPVIPLVNSNNGGTVTGIQLQNSTGTATSVTISYQPGLTGTACTETQTIPGNGTKTFALAAFSNNQSGTSTNCIGGQTFVGSAKVTGNSANVSLVGIVNQLNSGSVKGGAYNAFDPTTATKKVIFPLVMDRNAGYFTGFQVQNVGSTTASVTCTFSNSTRVVSQSLVPGQSLNDIQNNQFWAGYVGSSVCQGTNTNDKLAGVINQLGPSSTQDQLLVNEGFNTQ